MITEPAPAPIDPSAHWCAVAAELRKVATVGDVHAHRRVATRPTRYSARSLAYDIRHGRLAAFRPAGHYQAWSDGYSVVARYTGPPAPDHHDSPTTTGDG